LLSYVQYSGTCKTEKSVAIEKAYILSSFKCLTLELLLLYSSIWIRIRTFLFGSGLNLRILSDSDHQHSVQVPFLRRRSCLRWSNSGARGDGTTLSALSHLPTHTLSSSTNMFLM
jgi:hypothetical protein